MLLGTSLERTRKWRRCRTFQSIHQNMSSTGQGHKQLTRSQSRNNQLEKVEEGIAAVVKFSGKPTEDIVHEKEKALHASLIRDGLKLKEGCSLAVTSKLNSFYKSLVFFILFAPFGYKRNEVLLGLEEFTLD